MKTCIFAGTFDPFTVGHYGIVKKTLEVFDKVVIAIGINKDKTPLFPIKQRLKLIKKIFKGVKGVKVTFFEGYLVDYMKENRIVYNVRGIRDENDLRYETVMEEYNKRAYDKIITVYMNSALNTENISSTNFRKKLNLGEDIKDFTNGFNDRSKKYLNRMINKVKKTKNK